MSQKPFLRDLIYFDFDKTASIASQLGGGLIKEIQDTNSETRELGGGINVQIAKIGGNANDSQSKLIIRSIHHDLLVRVEDVLFENKIAVDLNQGFDPNSKSIEELHEIISEKYVRVEGISAFQDYQRMKRYIDGVSALTQLMSVSSLHQQGKADEYHKLQSQIDQMNNQLRMTNQNKKKTLQGKIQKLKARQKKIEGDASLHQQARVIPESTLKAFKEIIDLIMPNRNCLAMQPFENLKEFKVYSNLKQDCYIDRDPDNILFHYSSQPNVNLTVFGLVTSMPEENKQRQGHLFKTDTSQSVNDSSQQSAQIFNQLFEIIEPIEQLGQVAHYPSIIVYPLAVYYTIHK